MLHRLLAIAALAAVAGASIAPGTAEAGSRWRLNFFLPQYYTFDENDPEFYEPDIGDEDFYEPRFVDPDDEPEFVTPRKKKKIVSVEPKPVVKKKVATAAKKPTVATTASKSGMSCDKAGNIISGYGFTSIKPQSCAGKVYVFNATRSGKNYLVKLSSASGELTEVKKIQ